MSQHSNRGRSHDGWNYVILLPLLAIFSSTTQNANQQSGQCAPTQILPNPLSMQLPEAPPAHPPAAPCGTCATSCGGGPGGIPNVYLHSGEFHLEEVDLVISGRGLDFVWARTYRSRIGPDSAQGHGWDFSYNLKIEPVGTSIRVMDGNGRSDLYRPRPDGSYAAREFFCEGHFEPDGTFRLVFADRGSWTFLPLDGSALSGKLKSIADRNGNTLGFDYDGSGRLNLVVDTLGRQIHVAHDASGHITSVTDFLGRQWVYDYYQAGEMGGSPGDLQSARSPLVIGTPNGNDFPAGKTTSYTYSTGFADERLNHNLLTITDPKGQSWLANEYADEQDPSKLLFDRVVRQHRGALGDIVDVNYALVVQGQKPRVLAIVNDPVGNVSEYEYDFLARCVARREFTGRADPDLPTTQTSNRPVNPLRDDDPPLFETRWSYNADSLASTIVEPNGNVIGNVYQLDLDPLAAPRTRGNLRERHRFPGAHTPVGDQSSLSESFEYDAAHGGCCGSNFVTRHIDARGNTTEHDYDSIGNRLQTRHRIPSIVEDFTYNGFGQMTSHTHPDNGSGWRQVDRWSYYGAASGPQHGYLRLETLDVNGFQIETGWVYDGAGNAIQVTDAKGNVTSMVFNALGQVVRQTSPAVQMLNGATAQYQVDTWFDANDNVVRVDTANVDDQGNLAPNAYLTTSFEYEVLNRQSRKIEEIDAASSVVTEYEYDANRNRTLVRFGQATSGAQPTNVERFLFDERNLLFRKIRAEGDADQSTAQSDYDGNRNLVRVERGLEDAELRLHTWTFDSYGRVVGTLDPMGNVTTINYDPNGNLVHERFDGELVDVPGSAGNVRLFEGTYVYDAMDRLVASQVQHFDSATQLPIGDGASAGVWTWMDRSELETFTDDRGNVTSYSFDTAGRLELVTDAKGNSQRTTYDENHNVVQVTETEKSDSGAPDRVFVTVKSYDALDRATLEQDSLGHDRLTGYDSQDNPSRVTDNLGNVTTHGFDGLNRLLSSTRILTSDGTGSGQVVGQIVRSLSWDKSSRLVAQTDANGNVTSYAYDALGRRVRTTWADGSQETLEYDAHDNVVLRIDANGTRVTDVFDLSNRLGSRSITTGPGVSGDTTFEIWKHDGLARLVHAEDDDSLVTRAWDSLSSHMQETQNGKTLVCTHDGMGNELGLVYPGGKQVSYTYDALNRIKTITNTGPVASYDYVGRWRVERRRTAGGMMTSLYGFDGARRTTSIDHYAGAANALDRRTFQWDAMYDKTKSTDVLSGAFQDFGYDSQYRLIRSIETTSAGVVRDVGYAFDGVGNRTTVTGGDCDGHYSMTPTLPEPADRQVNQYTLTPCVGPLVYDRNGNQVRRGSIDLVYDYQDRLVRQRTPSGNTLWAYDVLGRNISKSAMNPVMAIRYYYHGLDVIEERDDHDVVLAIYVRGRATSGLDARWEWAGFNPQPEPPIGREIVEMEALGQRYFFFGDDLGSVRAVTDDAGAVVERYGYDEAGMPSFFDGAGLPLSSSAIGNAWLFTGQRWDEETGFYYFNRRYMDPVLGQFLSRDPLGIWGDAVNLGNARTYVANNFQTLVDPTGMYSKACSGPWSGSKTVFYGYVDCQPDSAIPKALCRSMGAAYQAKKVAQRWVTFELDGYPGGLSWWTAVPFLEWFAGPNHAISDYWMFAIQDTLEAIYEPFRTHSYFGIECESGCNSTKVAYVSSDDSNIHLCWRWWSMNARDRASVLLHELSHSEAGTEDHFYMWDDTASTFWLGNGSAPNLFETNVLATNADTYRGLYLKYFVK